MSESSTKPGEDGATDVGAVVLAFASRVERLRAELRGLRAELESLASKGAADPADDAASDVVAAGTVAR